MKAKFECTGKVIILNGCKTEVWHGQTESGEWFHAYVVKDSDHWKEPGLRATLESSDLICSYEGIFAVRAWKGEIEGNDWAAFIPLIHTFQETKTEEFEKDLKLQEVPIQEINGVLVTCFI